MLEELDNVLIGKTWGEKEKNLIKQAFQIIQNYFDDEEFLLNFIENIKNIQIFEIVSDVNSSEYYKSQIVKLDPEIVDLRKKYSKLFENSMFFRKENSGFILDPNGDYRLSTLGTYQESKKEITIFGENIEAFFHEYKHSTQKDFYLNPLYFGSMDLRSQLLEGDAVDFELTPFQKDLQVQTKICKNLISYSNEHFIFLVFKFLFGKNLIKKWTKDYELDLLQQFNFYFNTDILSQFLAYIYFLHNSEVINEEELSKLLALQREKIKSLETEIIQREKYKQEIVELEKNIFIIKNELNDKNFLLHKAMESQNEAREEREQYRQLLDDIHSYQGNKEELKNYFLSRGEKYDENIDYEAYIKSVIQEYDNSQNENYENEIKEELKRNLKYLELKYKRIKNWIIINEEKENHYKKILEIYNTSLNSLLISVDLFKQYQTLNLDDRNCFLDNILLNVQIILQEGINKKLDSKENTEFLLNDYSNLFRSLPGHINYGINDNQIYDTHKRLLEILNSSQIYTILKLKQENVINSEQLQQFLNILEFKNEISNKQILDQEKTQFKI